MNNQEILWKLKLDTSEIQKIQKLFVKKLKLNTSNILNLKQLKVDTLKVNTIKLKNLTISVKPPKKPSEDDENKNNSWFSKAFSTLSKKLAPLFTLYGIFKLVQKLSHFVDQEFHRTKDFSKISYYLPDVKNSSEAYRLMNSARVNPYVKDAIFQELSRLAYAKAQAKVFGAPQDIALETTLSRMGTTIFAPMDAILKQIHHFVNIHDKNLAFTIAEAASLGNIVHTYQREKQFGTGYNIYTPSSLTALETGAALKSNVNSMVAKIESATITIANDVWTKPWEETWTGIKDFSLNIFNKAIQSIQPPERLQQQATSLIPLSLIPGITTTTTNNNQTINNITNNNSTPITFEHRIRHAKQAQETVRQITDIMANDGLNFF